MLLACHHCPAPQKPFILQELVLSDHAGHGMPIPCGRMGDTKKRSAVLGAAVSSSAVIQVLLLIARDAINRPGYADNWETIK